jgi:hypothetical protein
MWIDITRGMAALKSVWNVGSTETAGETVISSGEIPSTEFLAEAQIYIQMGRHQSAAILAGDALENTLRQLCVAHSVAVPGRATVDGMNAELARKGVYDPAVEQRLSVAASLSDKANCGLWSELSKDDVEMMLAEVRAFAEEHASR